MAAQPPKTVTLGVSEALYGYALAHSHLDPLLDELAAATRARFPERMTLLTPPEEGALLTLLARALHARHVVEVGTFTGASALCLARGLAPRGIVRCYERDPEVLEVARAFWTRAGVNDRIEVELGDARERLRSLPAEPPVDLAFIDADKESYPTYLRLLVERLAPHGLIVVDNTLAGGGVLSPEGGMAEAIAAFNADLVADDSLTALVLPVADGITLVQRRAAGPGP